MSIRYWYRGGSSNGITCSVDILENLANNPDVDSVFPDARSWADSSDRLEYSAPLIFLDSGADNDYHETGWSDSGVSLDCPDVSRRRGRVLCWVPC